MTEIMKPTTPDDLTFRRIISRRAKNEPDDKVVLRQAIAELEADQGGKLSTLVREAVNTAAVMVLSEIRSQVRKTFLPQPAKPCERGLDVYDELTPLDHERCLKNVLKAIRGNGIDLGDMNGIELRQFAKSLDRGLAQSMVKRLVVEKAIRKTPAEKNAIVSECFPAADANAFYLKALLQMRKPLRLPAVV